MIGGRDGFGAGREGNCSFGIDLAVRIVIAVRRLLGFLFSHVATLAYTPQRNFVPLLPIPRYWRSLVTATLIAMLLPIVNSTEAVASSDASSEGSIDGIAESIQRDSTSAATHALAMPLASTRPAQGDGSSDTIYELFTSEGHHLCGLHPDGSVTCWGRNEFGQTDIPGGTFQDVVTGLDHTCGLRSDGSIDCWGRNDLGQVNAPRGTFRSVALWTNLSCALHTDRRIMCWGFDGTLAVDQSMSTAAERYSCGQRGLETPEIVCWSLDSAAGARSYRGPFIAVSTFRRSCWHHSGCTEVFESEDSSGVTASEYHLERESSRHWGCSYYHADTELACADFGSNEEETVDSTGEVVYSSSDQVAYACGSPNRGVITCDPLGSPESQDTPATVLDDSPEPAVAQSQTSWYVNDDPSQLGPADTWYRGDPGHGYGANNYRYTYGIGGASSAENWARWNMGSRVGRQEIQVYVPSNHATATVNYNIDIGGRTSKDVVAQRDTSGWYSLGNWNANGADVVISVYDNDVVQHWERDGLVWSSIGVDAIRMRCVSDCSSTPSTTTPTTTTTTSTTTTASTRTVTLSLGDTLSDCPDQTKGCRQLITTLTGFSAGSYSGRCLWGLSASSVTNTFANVTAQVLATGLTARHNPCNFNGTQGRYLTVIYDNVRSNTIQFAVDEPTTTPPPDSGTEPWAPWLVVLRVVESPGSRALLASWTPPLYDGGSPITGYTVTASGPGYIFGPYNKPVSARSHTVLYEPGRGSIHSITVAAKNLHGTGPSASRTYTIAATVPGAPTNVSLAFVESPRGNRLKASWDPPGRNNDGGSEITGYRITLTRDGETFATSNPSARSRSRTLLTDPTWTTEYEVTVAAKNKHGTGKSSTDNVKTPCPKGGKYRIENKFIYATTSFTTKTSDDPDYDTISEVVIRSGTKGGRVYKTNDFDTLTQEGCSWIFPNAEVEDEGTKVSGDATIGGKGHVFDGAQISGSAMIWGNAEVKENAEVYGNAKVYGSAKIDDRAEVYGNAKVYGKAKVEEDAEVFGDAEVSGGAVIKGTAKIGGDLKIEKGEFTSGTFDGISENVRLFVATHNSVYSQIRGKLLPCKEANTDNDKVNQLVKALIRLAENRKYSQDEAVGYLYACISSTTFKGIADAVKPGWTGLLPYNLGDGKTLKKLASIAEDLEKNPLENAVKMANQLQTLYNDIWNSMSKDNPPIPLCDKVCKGTLKKTVNSNWG